MRVSADVSLRALSERWRSIVRGPRSRALVAGVTLAVVAALFVSRVGTLGARVGAAVMLLAVAAALVGSSWWEGRVWREPARAIRRVAERVAPEACAKAVRALTLLPRKGEAGTSAELADLHVRRQIASISPDAVIGGARKTAFAFGVATLLLAGANMGACAKSPWGVIEGADVLVASNGKAPLDLAWLADQDMHARPPEYLHEEEQHHGLFGDVRLPRGTLITMRGVPLHEGRHLALSDGDIEVPFIDDGAGHVIARWPLAESVDLRVVARFGDVVINEPQSTHITSIPDETPRVTLEGAPKTIRLSIDEDASEIPIRYEVTDDHGLREVQLVLRAGAREERRVLARLDGETRVDRGGHVLRPSDPFLKKTHVPVEIRVEAKDNDAVTGPKWGKSEAITVIGPDVGEPEAKRLDALRKLRDALVDGLAIRMTSELPAAGPERRAALVAIVRSVEQNDELLEGTLTSAYAGMRVPARLGAMLRGKMKKLLEAAAAFGRAPTTSSRATLTTASERIVLVVDAMIQGLGLRDTRARAKDLADIADDLALGAVELQRPTQRHEGALREVHETSDGASRMDAAESVLTRGAAQIAKLGALGRDLSEIVVADLARVERGRETKDGAHAELAARDLAARLRTPDPSFGARGRGGRAGGESGGGRGTPDESDEGDEGDEEQAFNEAAREINRLTADHATEMGRVEQALSMSGDEEDARPATSEAQKHADSVRDAARELGRTGAAATAREHAEQMARAIEQGNAADAVASGRSAMDALDEAKREAQGGYFNMGDPRAQRLADDAKGKLSPEVKWAESTLGQMKKRAAERAAGKMPAHGENEGKLADRARAIGGRNGEDMPQAAAEALSDAERAARDASRALMQGDAERGLALQRDAQQKLEQARQALGDPEDNGDEGSSDGSNDGESRDPSGGRTDIPNAEAHKGPEEFRRRVIHGLGQPSGGRQRDAVRRYAEGLLR